MDRQDRVGCIRCVKCISFFVVREQQWGENDEPGHRS